MPIVAPVATLDAEYQRWARVALSAPKVFDQARVSVRRAASTEYKRGISAIYNLPQGRAAQDLSVIGTEAGFRVRGSKRTISLASYGWRPTRKGLAGRIIKGGRRTVIPRSFIAPAPGGGKVPFIREGEPRKMTKGRYAGKVRQPLAALHGPSIADAIKDQRVAGPMQERIWGRTRTELSRRLNQLARRR